MPTQLRVTRELIVKLFGSQLGAARQLKKADRTVRYWCSIGAPPHVMRALKLYDEYEVDLRGARRIINKQRGRRVIRGNSAHAG